MTDPDACTCATTAHVGAVIAATLQGRAAPECPTHPSIDTHRARQAYALNDADAIRAALGGTTDPTH